MGNLLVSLANSTAALRVFERQLNVIQNNVTNANTPGYVKQIQTTMALPFDPDVGIPGGTKPAPLIDSRSDFLEGNVRRQASSEAFYEQKTKNLGQLESTFDLNSQFSVATAFTGFFKSFAQLSINPNDQVARQGVIDQASEVAASFRQTARGLNAAGASADNEIRDGVTRVNSLVGRLREINAQRRQNADTINDPALNAEVYSTLEELTSYAEVNALRQDDGTYTLLLGGQVAALVGDRQYKIQADFSSSQSRILDASGQDVNSILTTGKLGSLLAFKNTVNPSYRDELDKLAQAFADQVNEALAAGVDRFGNTPTKSLFVYDPITGPAYTLQITDIRPDQIAAALAAAPGGNGNALQLARLSGQPLVDGFTFTQFYGNLSARVGRDLSTAKNSAVSQQKLLTQAQRLRSEASSVSLDEEAAHLIQVQRSYQAAGKLIGILQELTQTLIGLIR